MATSATVATSASWWEAVAFACLGLRVLGAVAVGARWVPPWSGPLVEVLLWIGGLAIVDPPILRHCGFWIGLLALLALWAPVVAVARRTSARRVAQVAVLVAAVFALAVQAAVTQGVVAGTVVEATAGQVCQWPRTITDVGGDLYPAPAGTSLSMCVQGRPGGGYVGDYPGLSCQQGNAKCVYPDPARRR